ncbi:MAG: NifU family protein [Mangrovicoccus sp.]|nr:NifU family protein [Mangrovicoccus sp.]
MSAAKEAILVAKIIEEMRPVFKADGGDVELVDMEGSMVLVHLTGACSGCQLASQTLGGLGQKITQALGRPVRVMPVAMR